MTTLLDAGVAAPELTLARRLRAVVTALRLDVPDASGSSDEREAPAGELLIRLVEHLREDSEPAALWLVLVAVCGGMPMPNLVRVLQRKLDIMSASQLVGELLDMAFDDTVANGRPGATLEIVTNGVLVDVDHTVTHPKFVTGIQRVVRETAGAWVADHGAGLVAWDQAGYRGLTADEAELFGAGAGAGVGAAAQNDDRIVVPWGIPVVLFEVPSIDHSRRLEAAAEAGAFSLRLVGYDCIPVASGELVPPADREKFGMYLEMLKWSDRLAGISDTAAEEFRAFRGALRAQGLTGPSVYSCPLPTVTPVGATSAPASPVPGDLPLVLCVGSLGRRKNQLTLVEASELLWREGMKFRLALVGSGDIPPPVLTQLIRELQDAGRPLTVKRGVSDEELAATYQAARCVAFVSVHEGFGLPVAEALSHEVPVITSNFGSLRELAEGNGGLLVDPEDVFQVADAIRSLLTDDALHARLVSQAKERPARTWSEYARELWEVLVA
jgi:glycosyltransferase involved in cell wall biosynthesis